MGIYLGLDTSNYSTSIAVYDSEKQNFQMYRRLLPVPENQVGLRQSDAVFYHVKQLSSVVHEITRQCGGFPKAVSAIGVSAFPRRVENSYMPCFLVGKMVAECLGEVLNCSVYPFSHQEGHVLAALYSSKSLDLLKRPFLAFHISGGTTEALLVSLEKDDKITTECVAKTLDLHAGQLVDRVGVMLGCRFPAGPELERLALNWKSEICVRATLKGNDICLSGVQNQCESLYRKTGNAELVARFCLESIRVSLERMTENLIREYGNLPIVFSGGVMSNQIIKNELIGKGDFRFAEPAFSADNAAGIALLAALREEKHE